MNRLDRLQEIAISIILLSIIFAALLYLFVNGEWKFEIIAASANWTCNTGYEKICGDYKIESERKTMLAERFCAIEDASIFNKINKENRCLV